jgi:hypothetical protein
LQRGDFGAVRHSGRATKYCQAGGLDMDGSSNCKKKIFFRNSVTKSPDAP